MNDEKNSDNEKSNSEQIVIPDECGDTMWDAVLAQDFFKKTAAEFNEKKIQETLTEKNNYGK
jgi:hypothetical protein